MEFNYVERGNQQKIVACKTDSWNPNEIRESHIVSLRFSTLSNYFFFYAEKLILRNVIIQMIVLASQVEQKKITFEAVLGIEVHKC